MRLEDITKEMGEQVIFVWNQTGIKKAIQDGIAPHELPDYLREYIKERYGSYLEQNKKSDD